MWPRPGNVPLPVIITPGIPSPADMPTRAQFPSEPPSTLPSYPGPLSPEFLTMITGTELKYNNVIQNIKPATHGQSIPRAFSRNSSLGTLACLPTELLHLVLGELDMLSLIRLTRTSLATRAAVDALPGYRLLLTHAGEAVAALGRTRLISHHPLPVLLAALQSSPWCVCCGGDAAFGAFLYLPTAERTCYLCNRSSPSLALVTLTTARRAFALPADADLAAAAAAAAGTMPSLPVLRPVSGAHLVHRVRRGGCGLPYETRSGLRAPLVSVRQARRLAVAVHGSDAAVAALVPHTRQGKMTRAELLLLQGVHALPAAHHPGYAFWAENKRVYPPPILPKPEYGGLAAVAFPYVPAVVATGGGGGGGRGGSEVDHGRMCIGCVITQHEACHGRLPQWALQRMPSAGDGFGSTMHVVRTEENRVRGWDEHWRHVRGCWGVKRMMLEDGQRLKLFLGGDDMRKEWITLMERRGHIRYS